MRWFLVFLVVGGCCGSAPPSWEPLPPVALAEGQRVTVALDDYASDDGTGLSYLAEPSDGVLAAVSDGVLTLLPDRDFTGETRVRLTAFDACGNESSTTVEVTVGTPSTARVCETTITYEARSDADVVAIAGSFNDWDPSITPMEETAAGSWSVTLDLEAGAWPYKVVEYDYGAGGDAMWACDPDADFVQCDEGYVWDPSCPPGGSACNSLLIVEDCAEPVLTLTSLDLDREARTVTAVVSLAGEGATADARLDGAVVDGWSDGVLSIASGPLDEGRHTLRVEATSADGVAAEPLYVPFWFDERDWENGLLYYVFVDRFANGDPSLDQSEGTTDWRTDYWGGDWRGVVDRLDYLDDLGVTALWLTAPQQNPDGAWDGLCSATYAGYHGYWPSDPWETEGHFGDDAMLRELIDEAHARGMRVLTDWVGNHVHTDHPYYTEHPDWFSDLALCGDANNWDDIPETCWFASYLPDIRYYQTEPLVAFVDEALAWVKDYELDGYRVDAVKHMPHAVFWNFQTRVRTEIEHSDVGGDEDFYTVGETFTGDRDLIGAYVNANELDGQFDFPLYWAIVAAFARDEIGLSDGDGSLRGVHAESEGAFAPHLMSTFLGNHDVVRFIAQANGEISSLYGDGSCGDDGLLRAEDLAPAGSEPYERLMLAWSFLLTTEGLPLVYYGDEIGLPGNADPDNRLPMRFDDDLSADEAAVLAHVQTLGQARLAHPALSTGTRTSWWDGEPGFYAYARVNGGDQALVLLNRDGTERTVENGLAFAGLDATTWQDVLTGERFTASGDRLSVTVPARGSRVLVGVE